MPFAVVTGASSGIGFASALEFHRRGYTVFACARRLEKMEPLKEKGIITVKCDITSAEDVKALKELVLAQTAGLDVLYNNAGVPCEFDSTVVSDEAAFKCFNVNVLAPIRLTREFVPLLKEAQGVVAFTGSVASVVPLPFNSIYAATKGAIQSYTNCLHLELSVLGIKVVNLATGGVDTEIIDNTPVPKDSLFYFPEGIAIKEALYKLIIDGGRQPADVYAKNAVNDIINAKPSTLNKYRGSGSSTMLFASYFLPRSLLEWAIKSQLKMYPAIKKSSKKEN